MYRSLTNRQARDYFHSLVQSNGLMGERWRDTEREREGKKEGERVCVCVCVFVRERERVGVCVREGVCEHALFTTYPPTNRPPLVLLFAGSKPQTTVPASCISVCTPSTCCYAHSPAHIY